jgi:hypothetical protein
MREPSVKSALPDENRRGEHSIRVNDQGGYALNGASAS